MKLPKVLLVLPVFSLFALGAFLQNKEKRQALENSKPFKVFFANTETVSSVGTNNTWRIEIRTFIDCEGRRPDWWGKGGAGFDHSQWYFESRGKKYQFIAHGFVGGWSEKRKQYYLTGVFNSGKARSALQPANFVSVINFGSGNRMKLRMPIGNDERPFAEDRVAWATNN